MRKLILSAILTAFLLYGFLFILSLILGSDFSYMGVKNDSLAEMVFNDYIGTIIFTQFKVFLIYGGISISSGLLLAWFFGHLVRFFKLPSPGKISLFLSHTFLWTIALLSQIVYYPQLFVERFYLTEFAPFMVWVTNTWHPFIFAYVILSLIIFNTIFTAIRFPKSTIGLIVGLVSLIYLLRPKSQVDELIILLGMDSVRWDKLKDERIAPDFVTILNESVQFTNVWADVPRTFPSWTSILSGQHAVHHGIRHMFPTKADRKISLPTLQKELKRNGWKTGVVSDFAGDIFSRMDYGFDQIKAPYLNFPSLINQRGIEIHFPLFPFLINRIGREIFPELKQMANNPDPFLLNLDIFQMIDNAKGKLFLTTFWSAAHFPYAPPWPYYQLYSDQNYVGANKYQKMDLVGFSSGDEADHQALRNLYDGGVRSMNDAFKELIQFLNDRDLLKKTTFIILSDHGEYLFEEGKATGHGEHLRGADVLNIPVVFWQPGRTKKKEIKSIGTSADIAPTLAEFLNISQNVHWTGKSLFHPSDLKGVYSETGLWFTDVGEWFYQKQRIIYPDVTVICEVDKTYNNEMVLKQDWKQKTLLAKHRAWITDEWKLIYIPLANRIIFELYDRKNDSNELVNVADQFPDMVNQLFSEMKKWVLENEKGSSIYDGRIISTSGDIR